VVVIDRTINRAVKQGTEISFELTPQTEFKGQQSGQPLTAAALEKGRPVVVGYTVRSGQVVADWVRIEPGPVIAFESEGGRAPQQSTPTRPPTPGRAQGAQASTLEQPWQTSWEAFCGELQRLFRNGAKQEEMDVQFAGKPVIWEGEIIEFDGPDKSLVVRMPKCRVTVAEANNRSAEVGVLVLRFKSLDEIYRLGGITVPAKVRFSTVLRTPPDPNSPAGKFSNFGIFHPVSWIEEEGEETRLVVLVGIGDGTKLLEYLRSQAQDPTGYIPSINAKVASLRFFENPPQGIPREQRVYGTRFLQSQVNRIFWELTLEHPAPGRRVNFLIESVWHSPTTAQGLRRTMRASLRPEWTWSYWHDGGRIIAGQSEPWPVGSYRVDLYVAGAKVTSGAFEITNDKSPASDSESAALREAQELAKVAYQNAQRLTEKGKYQEAIEQLTMASALDPEFTPAYALRGSSYYALSFFEGKDTPQYRRLAIQDYTTAIEKDLKHGLVRPDQYVYRGAIHFSQGEYQQALADFSEAIKIDPRRVDAIGNRGEVRRSMGDLDGSLADFTRVIELEPKVGTRYCQRGVVWLLKEKDTEAQNDFRRCAELDPKKRQEYTETIKKVLEERKQKP
jgi:Tfp pilus assembly protein PilF